MQESGALLHHVYILHRDIHQRPQLHLRLVQLILRQHQRIAQLTDALRMRQEVCIFYTDV
jgi:hypothetical protein